MGSLFLSHSGRYFAGRSLCGAMADFPQHNVHQSHAPRDRDSSVYREIASGDGLNAGGLIDGPTGLNRCRSAKM